MQGNLWSVPRGTKCPAKLNLYPLSPHLLPSQHARGLFGDCDKNNVPEQMALALNTCEEPYSKWLRTDEAIVEISPCIFFFPLVKNDLWEWQAGAQFSLKSHESSGDAHHPSWFLKPLKHPLSIRAHERTSKKAEWECESETEREKCKQTTGEQTQGLIVRHSCQPATTGCLCTPSDLCVAEDADSRGGCGGPTQEPCWILQRWRRAGGPMYKCRSSQTLRSSRECRYSLTTRCFTP